MTGWASKDGASLGHYFEPIDDDPIRSISACRASAPMTSKLAFEEPDRRCHRCERELRERDALRDADPRLARDGSSAQSVSVNGAVS